MKLLVVGSKSVHISSFIKALNSKGIIPYFLNEEKCDYTDVKEEFSISFRSLNPLTILSKSLALKKLLKQLKPDVVHVHQANRLAYFVSYYCAKDSIPCMTTAWGSDVLEIPKKNAFYRFITRKIIERSKRVTADSLEMIAEMKTLVPDVDRYVHLQYGIDPIPKVPKEKIIYSNRLHQTHYRIDQIINYFAEFHVQNPEWQLIVGAVGVETDKLKALVEERGLAQCVQFVGWLNQVENHAWYAKAMIYISIPSHDGTAVSLLEAMSAGCIPIVPDLAVSKEWIVDGENGVIEKVGQNPLIEAMQIDSVSCTELNKKRIGENASRDKCTDRFIELYMLLVK